MGSINRIEGEDNPEYGIKIQLVRARRLELLSLAWKARAQPLYHAR